MQLQKNSLTLSPHFPNHSICLERISEIVSFLLFLNSASLNPTEICLHNSSWHEPMPLEANNAITYCASLPCDRSHSLRALIHSCPLITGIERSMKTTRNCISFIFTSASWPFSAKCTTIPNLRSLNWYNRRTESESSTTRTFLFPRNSFNLRAASSNGSKSICGAFPLEICSSSQIVATLLAWVGLSIATLSLVFIPAEIRQAMVCRMIFSL
mmetsp:Transcript_17027/g.23507  ORF Transcript_17027/g.23507 Transcript_17027/m.23507 type:complete len:213 (-) Transcript_17027:584-1222(-)